MKARNALLIVAAALALAACKSEQELAGERALINSRLPEGCEMVDLGEYDDIEKVVAVICDRDRVVTTTARNSVPRGKTRVDRDSVVVSGL